jgi:hypothetical protein
MSIPNDLVALKTMAHGKLVSVVRKGQTSDLSQQTFTESFSLDP